MQTNIQCDSNASQYSNTLTLIAPPIKRIRISDNDVEKKKDEQQQNEQSIIRPDMCKLYNTDKATWKKC